MTGRLVITGVDGFVGRHLAAAAHAAGREVIGIARAPRASSELAPHLADYLSADLRERWPSAAPVDAPIIHLAGLAAVGPSFDRPQDYIDANSAMVTNMCEAFLAAGSSARVVGVSTGAVYANSPGEQTRSESGPIAFTSPYVVSKVLVENQLAYYQGRGLDTVVARPFNHIGPGQGPGFLVPDLLRRLRELDPGTPLSVGNLATRRDYTDVRDVARAYLALASAPTLRHDLYNVASGTARSGAEVLDTICAALHIDVPEVAVNPAWIRATDPDAIVGDAARLQADTGWTPSIRFETTIRDTVAEGAD